MNSSSASAGQSDFRTLLGGQADSLMLWTQPGQSRAVSLNVAAILVGAGLYGAAMGWWRDPMQSLYVGIKFPLILLLTALGNALLNAMLAPLLGLNHPKTMNDLNPTGQSVPPQIPPPAAPPRPTRPALGDDPAERIPVPNPIAAIEAILRQPRRLMYSLRQPGADGLIAGMLLIAVACSLIYGVVVGSFSGHEQWWAAPVKISVGLLVSTLICLPSLYIFASLSGSQARLAEMFGLVVGLLMLMTILLVGFAPVAWLFSQSTQSLAWMGALHLIFWLVSTVFGLRFLNAGFACSNARSNAGLNTWIAIFMLVMLQMTTALRPLVGTADTFLPEQKKFFVTHWSDCLDATTSGKKPRNRD